MPRRRADNLPRAGDAPPALGCRSCEGAVVQAPAPARIVEGGMPTEALIAQVLVAKYADHIPL